jgi:uncharacterized membrane protein
MRRSQAVVFGGLSIIRLVLGTLFITGMGFHTGVGVFPLLWIIRVVLWILLMINAYQGERFRVPIGADLADQIFGRS